MSSDQFRETHAHLEKATHISTHSWQKWKKKKGEHQFNQVIAEDFKFVKPLCGEKR